MIFRKIDSASSYISLAVPQFLVPCFQTSLATSLCRMFYIILAVGVSHLGWLSWEPSVSEVALLTPKISNLAWVHRFVFTPADLYDVPRKHLDNLHTQELSITKSTVSETASATNARRSAGMPFGQTIGTSAWPFLVPPKRYKCPQNVTKKPNILIISGKAGAVRKPARKAKQSSAREMKRGNNSFHPQMLCPVRLSKPCWSITSLEPTSRWSKIYDLARFRFSSRWSLVCLIEAYKWYPSRTIVRLLSSSSGPRGQCKDR